MKKLLLGSVALVALSVASVGSPAVAADMPVKAKPVPPPYTWSGCYVGGFVGYSLGKSRHRSLDPGNPEFAIPNTVGFDLTDEFDMSGAIGGFAGGCNAQWGYWVVGVEIDGAVTNKDGQDFDIPPFNPLFVSQTTERWLATARLRLGYAADKWLFYVTGGAAWAGVEVSDWLSTTPAITAHHYRNIVGWTVGAGWEYALGYGWSIKSEFLYVDFGFHQFYDPPESFSGGAFGLDTFVNPKEVSLKNYIFKVGMNYKFDFGKYPVGKYPVVAKY